MGSWNCLPHEAHIAPSEPMSSIDQQGSSLCSFPTSPHPPLYPHFNRPSGFGPCVKSCLVGGSDKYRLVYISRSFISLVSLDILFVLPEIVYGIIIIIIIIIVVVVTVVVVSHSESSVLEVELQLIPLWHSHMEDIVASNNEYLSQNNFGRRRQISHTKYREHRETPAPSYIYIYIW